MRRSQVKVIMDEIDLRRFADAVVEAQRAVAAEMAAIPEGENKWRDWDRAPWVYKWGVVIERALGKVLP